MNEKSATRVVRRTWIAILFVVLAVVLIAYVLSSRAPKIEVEVVGVRPEDVAGWKVAKGSTRSFSLLVNSTDRPDVVLAWA